MFKSMLAAKAPPADKLRFSLLASPKIDGIRGHIIDGQVVSRNGLPFPNPNLQWVFGNANYNGLDGEFVNGDPWEEKACRVTQSVTSSHTAPVDNLRFYVFDDFTDPTLPFAQRLANAHTRSKAHPHLVLVNHTLISNSEELDAFEASCMALGYEGIMTRTPAGKYKYGRSTPAQQDLLKIKRFEDSEAVIDGVEELMHNANEKTLVKNGKATRNTKKEGLVGRGTLGAVIVRDVHTGVRFNVGTGFDDAERSALWAMGDDIIGRVIKYRYFPTGSKTKPRFPAFVAFRDDL